jgi:hypothetical protein
MLEWHRKERFMTSGDPTNRSPRIDLRRSAALINSDGVQVAIVILDVSSGGFRVEASDDLRVGERVTLLAEHGEQIPAEIRWALGKEAGGMFLTSVDPAVLRDLNRRPDNG